MKRAFLNPTALRCKLECFGNYDSHDPICVRCQLNIRCAIARDQCEQLEILEDFIDTVKETTRVQ